MVNVILLRISGDTAVSAYGVIANLGNVVMCGLAGVSNAVQPLISFNYGAGQPKRVKSLLGLAMRASLILSAAYVIFAELRPDLLVAAFLDDPTPALSLLSTKGIRVISPGYILGGLSIVVNIYFEAVHMPNQAFWAAMVRGLIAPVVSTAVCALLGDIDGVWLSFLVTEAVSLIAVGLLYAGAQKKVITGDALPDE